MIASYISALIHLFKSDKVTILDKDRDKLLEYMISLCKSLASDKREKAIKDKDGKEPMSFCCYELTCEFLVVEGM